MVTIRMNNYVSPTQTVESSSYMNSSVQSSSSNDVSFKDELSSLKSNQTDTSNDKTESVDSKQDATKTSSTDNTDKDKKVDSKSVNNDDSIDANKEVKNGDESVSEPQKTEKTAGQAQKASDAKNAKNAEKEDTLNTVKQLNSQIEAMKAAKNSKTLANNSANKTTKKIAGIESDKKSIKMDLNDAKFFINLVHNEQYSVQNNINTQGNMTANNATAVLKSEATQQAVDVSSVLMAQLQDSMQTNKPFRLDFDNNIAVIMKVDKEGKLSANFIPGDKAVEAYLKANIPALQQSFDAQNLPYSDLSYSHAKQDNQRENNNRKNKENDNE